MPGAVASQELLVAELAAGGRTHPAKALAGPLGRHCRRPSIRLGVSAALRSGMHASSNKPRLLTGAHKRSDILELHPRSCLPVPVTRHVLVWYFATLSMIGVVYGPLATTVIGLLSLEIASIILLLGAQVIAEYERFAAEGELEAAPKPMYTQMI